MAQLAERSPTILEDPGSNPVIGNFYLNIYLLLTVCRKDENKEKEAENGPFLKNNTPFHSNIFPWLLVNSEFLILPRYSGRNIPCDDNKLDSGCSLEWCKTTPALTAAQVSSYIQAIKNHITMQNKTCTSYQLISGQTYKL